VAQERPDDLRQVHAGFERQQAATFAMLFDRLVRLEGETFAENWVRQMISTGRRRRSKRQSQLLDQVPLPAEVSREADLPF
jgi:hypothetical protein